MAEAKATVKPAAKAVVAKKAEVVKEAPAAKKETVKKAPAAKKEVAAKAPAAKKETVKKATVAKKPAAKKEAVKSVVNLQFAGKSYTNDDLVKIAKDVWKYDLGRKTSEFKTLELYVKPEESCAYYVINGEVTGSFMI